MLLFWISTIIAFIIIAYIVHKFFFKDVRGNPAEDKRLWKFWGIRTFYWQGVFLIALGIVALILAIVKWTGVWPLLN